MPWYIRIYKAIVSALFVLTTRWEVRGRENVPRRGGVLVVANHLNLADPPLLGISLSRRVIFMAKEELFRYRLSAGFFRNLGAFPVHRGRLDREAIRQAKAVLASGQALVMFPEAHRSHTAQLQPGYPGAALMAVHCAVPILPVGIAGSERLKGVGWLLRRPRVRVNIGRPFSLPTPGKPGREALAGYTELIMGRIAELLPVPYRGAYGGEVTKKDED